MDYSTRKLPSCAACPLFREPGPVYGVGPQHAKFIYIGEKAGPHEVNAHTPMAGPAGNVLNGQLFRINVRRDEIFITNQVKCVPRGVEVPPKAIECCKPLLERELAYCKSDTVVLAGAVAFKANIGDYSTLSSQYHPKTKKGQDVSIMERMGCVERRNGRKWIGTVNPAFVMRMPDIRDEALDHLAKAAIISGLTLPSIEINEHATDSQILSAVDHIILQEREFSHDVETVGLDDVDEDDYVGSDFKITMEGVSYAPYKALVMDPSQVHLLAPIFKDPTIIRFEHNGPYDQYHVEKLLGKDAMCAKSFDTMSGTHYLRSHRPKKLKPYVVSQYTNLPYYNRDLARLNERFYNGMDCVATLLAGREIRRQHEKWGLTKLFDEVGMPILNVCEEWRRAGVRVDLRKAALFKMLTEQKIEKAEQLIAKLAGPFFNWGSSQQRYELFYNKYKLPIQTKKDPVTRENKATTDFEARKRLRHYCEVSGRHTSGGDLEVPYLLLNLIDYISGERKKLEYLGRISPDSRIHPYYKSHGAASFRLSSKPNLQNFPVYDISAWGGARRDDNDDVAAPVEVDKDEERSQGELGSLRSIVIADHDEDLILTCDFEQLQLWLYAKIFGVKWLLEVFESREYIYGVVYEKLYKEPFFQEGKPKTKEFKLPVQEQRIRRAKAVPLGFLFGRSAEAVAEEYQWTPNEGQELRGWWYGLNPELPKSYNEIKYIINQKGYVKHAFGQLMHFPSLKLTEAINSFAQSNEAILVQKCVIQIDREIKRRGWQSTRTMLSVHDSLSINCGGAKVFPERMVMLYEEVVKPVLEQPWPELGGFALRHSAEVSFMWDWDVMKYSKWKAANVGNSL